MHFGSWIMLATVKAKLTWCLCLQVIKMMSITLNGTVSNDDEDHVVVVVRSCE